MMNLLSCLHIGEAPGMGRGVFCSEPIAAGTLVECSPVLVLTASERRLLDLTGMHDYIFEWGESRKECCVALGYLSLYNHSFEANCEYEMDFERRLISIHAVRDIEAGEQLFTNYNGDWNDPRPLWFRTNEPG